MVKCRDKIGIFGGGAPGYPSGRWHNLVGAEIICAHLAKLGYRYKECPPGQLLHGEMTICRV